MSETISLDFIGRRVEGRFSSLESRLATLETALIAWSS